MTLGGEDLLKSLTKASKGKSDALLHPNFKHLNKRDISEVKAQATRWVKILATSMARTHKPDISTSEQINKRKVSGPEKTGQRV